MNAEIIFTKYIWKKYYSNAVHVSYMCVQIASNIYQQIIFSKWTDVEQNKTSKLFIFLYIICLRSNILFTLCENFTEIFVCCAQATAP